MLSRVLWYIDNGFKALRLHTKFIFVIFLLFLFPLLFFYLVEHVYTTALTNISTVQKESVAVLHRSVHAAYKKDATVPDGLLEEFNTPTNLAIFDRNSNGTLQQLYNTSDTENNIDEKLFQITPDDGTAYIYEIDSATGRMWTVVSKETIEGKSITFITNHDFSELDQIILKRVRDLYWLLLLGMSFLFLVAYWLIRQTNWEAEYRRLNQNLKEQELLIGTITHEFRTPLTAIAGYLSFLHESNRLRPKDIESLNNIGLSTQRLLNLVNDFLEVTKIQAEKLELKVEQVSLAEIVYRVISEQGPVAANKQLVLRDASQNKDIILPTDKKRMIQVLTNIVNNAVKYTEKGSVVITYEQNPLYVTIRVQDTGSGISAEDQQNLFKPFSRVGGVEKTNIVGTGLGMWITKKLVNTLGGKIAVESIKGVGTHVVLTFDLRKIAAKTREGIL